MRSSKDQKTVIKQQPGPSPTVTKESGMFLMSGYSEMGQHIIPIMNTGPQEFFYKRKKEKTGSNMHTINHAWYTPPRKPFTPVVKSTPQLQLLGILFKKEG